MMKLFLLIKHLSSLLKLAWVLSALKITKS
jgi:hypothetical protein